MAVPEDRGEQAKGVSVPDESEPCVSKLYSAHPGWSGIHQASTAFCLS